MGLKDYMNEPKALNKWQVAIIFIIGMFAGAILGHLVSLFALM